MGWTYSHKDKSETVFDFFSRQFDYENEVSIGKVVDCAVKNFKTAYIAFKVDYKKTNETKIVAIICLLNYARNSYYNFGYKDMDETMGVFETDCPERILKILTPTDNETAMNWREKCWNKIKSNKKRPKMKVGDVIVFEDNLSFTNGVNTNTFCVIDVKKHIFRTLNNYDKVKISPKTLRICNYSIEGSLA